MKALLTFLSSKFASPLHVLTFLLVGLPLFVLALASYGLWMALVYLGAIVVPKRRWSR